MILAVLSHALGPGVKSLHEKQKNRRMAQHAEQGWGHREDGGWGREWPPAGGHLY